MDEALTLYELNGLIKERISEAFPSEYWLQAELGEVREHSSGHCFIEFVQKNDRGNGLVAKARGTIWNNVYRMFKPYFEKETGQSFVAGLKVLVKVAVEFHELYGYSLTVLDIDATYTVGDMARKRKEILERLQQEGVLSLNKELELPFPVQRIAIISSPTAAGYGDFCHQLQHNQEGFVFYTKLFPAVMQGEETERSVIRALNDIYMEQEHWDVVVLIRGGGATSDLSSFDSYDLAANCSQFPLPILVGLGHERDETVLDYVAHTSVKTPTAAAAFLIDLAEEASEAIDDCASRITSAIERLMSAEKMRIQSLGVRLPAKVLQRISEEKYHIQNYGNRLQQAYFVRKQKEQYEILGWEQKIPFVLKQVLDREKQRLQNLEQTLEIVSPERVLQRGYSLTLNKDGKAVIDASTLEEGDYLVSRFAKGQSISIVKSLNTENNERTDV